MAKVGYIAAHPAGETLLQSLFYMGQPIRVACELCGSEATLEVSSYTDANGKHYEWPKATVQDGGIYFSIHCPQCGSRNQLMAKSGDTLEPMSD